MRNLRNIKHITLDLSSSRPLSACAWDVLSNRVIFASGPSENEPLLELLSCPIEKEDGVQSLQPSHITSWDALCPLPNLASDHVLNIQYFADISSTCLILAGGDIVVVRELPVTGQDKIEIVGSVDLGILAACWSPDEELLAICTRGNTILFMSREFDNIASVEIVAGDLQASKHVSVGWGKAETQFRGKGAKALRDPTMPEKVEEGLLSSTDDGSTTISWRGDGQYVALNSLQCSPRRVIRIYSREGILDGVTEPVDYLEGAVSWRPTGNLLAGVQRLKTDANVIFFERNGLRHGDFSLRLNELDLRSWASSITLHWNADSTALAVVYADRVHLWTMGNYHYYLKNEILLPETITTSIPSFSWHPERPYLFSIGSLGDKSYLKILEYQPCICRGTTSAPDDNGAVAVIDGDTIKLTDLRFSNVPPPMAVHDISIESCIIDCAISDLGDRKIRVAAITNQSLYILDWLAKEPSKTPVVYAEIPYPPNIFHNPENKRILSSRQVAFATPDHLILLCSEGNDSVIYSIQLQDRRFNLESNQKLQSVKMILTGRERTNHRVYLGLAHGEVFEYASIPHPGAESHISRIGQLTRYWDSFEVNNTHTGLPQPIGLASPVAPIKMLVETAKNGGLFADGKRLATDCTSYVSTSDHIIFTTSKHLLKFVHVRSSDQLEVPEDRPEADERCRSIERGARIVTVVPSKSALILQMPRGNLETIYPRALVLAQIRRDINEGSYRRAFLTCRSQRVDMNILHDYKPATFLREVPKFIEQLEKVEYIDLFLSQLRDEDVSITMYQDTINSVVQRDNSKKDDLRENRYTTFHLLGESKVNKICDEFIRALRPLGDKRFQNVITAHVCKTPPDLVSGLKEVSRLRNAKTSTNSQTADSTFIESSIEHICFLVDINRLFDAALGIYDLRLALLVAQQSQKDPREYLPFLNKLQSQPPLRMKFDIDNHLGRKKLCLQHLQELKAFEEVKAYMIKHELYEDAIELYKYQDEKIEELMQSFASFLASHSRHKEAGIAYEYLKDYKSACESYQLANMWRECLTSAFAAGYEPEEIKDLAQTLSNGLIELRDYTSAAIVAYEHLEDVEAAARLFCKAYLFPNAARILRLNQREDLIEKVLDAGLVESMASMTEMLAECKAQLDVQVPRIRELRIKKHDEPLAFFDAGTNDDADIPDNVSLAATDASTTGGTLFTRYTNRTGTVGTNATRRTSKNRRREERKRAAGKKGSIYEEEYLINSVARLIERVNSVQDDISRLVAGLVQRRMRERARAVQDAMASALALCQACIPEVFQTDPEPSGPTPTMGAPNGIEGADGVLWASMEALRQKRPAPVVKSFAKLSLAG